MEISNEELLEDIKNTEIEIEGYKMLKEGYGHLAQLPENNKVPGYHINARYYADREYECSEFLSKLYHIRDERLKEIK